MEKEWGSTFDVLYDDNNYNGLEKVVISTCWKKSSSSEHIRASIIQLNSVTGRKPVLCKAKRSISNFKVRRGDVNGCKVTLRGKDAVNFLKKLFLVVLPSMSYFKGLKGNKGSGNYNIGIDRIYYFPELVASNDPMHKNVVGCNIAVVGKYNDMNEIYNTNLFIN